MQHLFKAKSSELIAVWKAEMSKAGLDAEQVLADMLRLKEKYESALEK